MKKPKLTDDELKRRHAARAKKRRAAGPDKRRSRAKAKPEAQGSARRAYSPADERVALARATPRGASSATMMRTDGLFSGHGFLMPEGL